MAKEVGKKAIPKIKSNEKILIENFVSLQRVMTNMATKFDDLSTQISKLLDLFELSANALAKKDINYTKPIDEKKIMDKLEGILNQNKVIAKGLVMMHEGDQTKPPQPIQNNSQQAPKKQGGEYQKSPFSGF